MKPEQFSLARELLKLSQVELAQVLDVHPRTVSKWERGVSKPSELKLRILEGVIRTASPYEFHEVGCHIRTELDKGRLDHALLWLLTFSTAQLRR